MAPSTDTNRISVGQGGTYHYSATVLAVFWPAIEHGKLIARWPHLTTEVGATWDEHRRLVERHWCPRQPGRPRRQPDTG